ncbi:pentatricopeptide repeat-containing protein At5g27110-like [Selaginella moellendorffii]|uniref:pentatricopeptide repeat-containing protein At5g27110-like n=1 Tax=Selaginella moellendorffii TaxID=88036 RepID=UPI000D1C3494|nr:pentatricopeptide repeat-containing protein At5g27110-like [Selaginella moellendorffii]|eukprot:XP_024525839.1 pentatricopeptide repeat-containing protein At5g27110-like [Selaginella moellendorffii]
MLRKAGKVLRYGVSGFLRFASDLAAFDPDKRIIPSAGLREALDHIGARGDELDSAYAAFLRKCGESGAAADAKLIHEHAIASGRDRGTFFGNVLVQIYGRCGDLAAAQAAFARIWHKNVYSWNIAIAAFANNGHFEDAVAMFYEMDAQPNRVTFLAVLGACSNLRDLEEAKRIHSHVTHHRQNAVDEDVVLCNALIHTYGKCGSAEDGKAVFDRMWRRDVVSWTSMIGCYAQDERYGAQALELFHRMDVRPTEITFVSALDACSSLGDIEEGRRIHAGIIAAGFQSQVFAGKTLGNALVNMYGKCGSLEDARAVFDRMEHRDLAGWNAMVGAYAQHGYGGGAVHTFHLMDLDGVKANNITFTSLLTGCSGKEMLSVGSELQDRVLACGTEADIILQNTFITAYSKCGSLEAARRAFDTMPRRNTPSWNAIIGACVQHGQMDGALRYFHRMDVQQDEVTFINALGACCDAEYLAEGAAIHGRVLTGGFEQDPVVGSALVNMYSKCGSLESARSVFDRLTWKTVVSWTAMIEAYVQLGHGSEALKLFQRMEVEGCKANDITFISVLGACTAAGNFLQGKAIQSRVVASDVILVALVNLYGKCGKFGAARELFDRMKLKPVVAWNAMLSAYSQQGQGVETLSLFHSMILDGVEPNSVTFMSLFPGCSHEGLVDRSWDYFRSMSFDHGVTPTPEVYGAMVDLLARQGDLDDSEDLINSMPFHADVVAWTALLGACKTFFDAERGVRVATSAMELDQVVPAPYSLLTSIFSGDADE